MKKMNKKAFTLIELLIVIAIIGILFVVLVSRVDFATDKAKATGVQTDFRSFQVAFEQVAKEHAGFNTFGWDTGDKMNAEDDDEQKLLDALKAKTGNTYTEYANKDKDAGDRVRNSYDVGDLNLNGKMDVNGEDGYTGTTEVWTGSKIYTEEWNGVYTLANPGDTSDVSAYRALETAINKNLDPKLQITIDNTGKITMANQAQDPWKNEYEGYYFTEATSEGKDRGAIIIYSMGANGDLASEHDIVDGVVEVKVTNNNIKGKDDYSIATIYTFTNGYGEVTSSTSGFSNNQ